MRLSIVRRPVALAAAVIALSGCAEKPAENPLLQHVPADTPYLLDASKPLPGGLYDSLMRVTEAQASQARADLETTMDKVRQSQAEATGSPDPKAGKALAMLEVLHAMVVEVGDKLDRDSLPALGVSPEARSVLYGIGPFPVMRGEVTDPAKLEAAIARIEVRSGHQAELVQADGYRYRRAELTPALDLVIAIRDDQFVAGVVPSRSPQMLALLLGDQQPAASMADADTLPRLRKRYGYQGYMDGYVDLQSLAKWFTGRGEGPAAEALTGLMRDVPELEPGCRTLVDGMVGGMPRLAFGMPEANDRDYVMTAMHEATPAVGRYLKDLAKPQPLPGMGVAGDSLASVGFDVDMSAVRSGLKALGRYVAETGRECSWVDADAILAELPKVDFALGPMLGGLSGIYLQLADLKFDAQTQQPTDAAAGILLAVQDPQGMLALGAMMNPALASLELPADGSAVAVPAGMLPPQVGTLYVAGGDGLLALAMGEGAAARTQSMLKAKRSKEPVWMSMDYDAARFAPIMAQLMTLSAMQMEAAGQMEQAEMMREQAVGMETGAGAFGRIDARFSPTAEGLSFHQKVELK